MKLAILPGFNVLVPQGKLVGGTFKSTPLCSQPGQTGCVITWVSFREKNVPPAGAIFGYRRQARHDRRLHQSRRGPARPAGSRSTAIGTRARRCPSPAARSSGRPRARRRRPSCAPKGWSRRRCVNDGPRGYLSIRTNADPKDKRTDRIGGEVGVAGHVHPRLGHAPRRHERCRRATSVRASRSKSASSRAR